MGNPSEDTPSRKDVDYCPFCGGDVSSETIEDDYSEYPVHECEECGEAFDLTVPKKGVKIGWANVA